MMSQGKDIATQIKDSMVLWYDIKRMLDGKLDDSTDANTYMSSNPTLVDLSGNGYDSTCYNFDWSGISGIGGYSMTSYRWNVYSAAVYERLDSYTIQITEVTPTNIDILIAFITEYGSSTVASGTEFELPPIRFVVTGEDANDLAFRVRGAQYDKILIENGKEYYFEGGTFISKGGNVGFEIEWRTVDNTKREVDIKVKLLPIYPNAIVSNGIDNYCLTSNLPAITVDKGFTVVAKREVTNGDEILTAFASKQADASEAIGAFTIERGGADAILGYRMQVNSFGLNNEITSGNKSGIMYCTSTDYNNILVLFKLDGSSDASYCGKYALYSFLLFNRDLTQTEINWVKTNLIEGDYKF